MTCYVPIQAVYQNVGAARSRISGGEHDVSGKLMLHVQVELLNHTLLEVGIHRLDGAQEIVEVRRSVVNTPTPNGFGFPVPAGYPPEIAHRKTLGLVSNDGSGQVPVNPGKPGKRADDASNGGLLTSPWPPMFHEESWNMAYPARSTVV